MTRRRVPNGLRGLALVLAVWAGSLIITAEAVAERPTIVPPLPGATKTVSGPGQAQTGDVVLVKGAAVYLAGIAAPVKDQSCYDRFRQKFDCFVAAKDVLTRMIGADTVTCQTAFTNSIGQQVGRCQVQGIDLGAAMIEHGYAMSYHSLTLVYDILEAKAQSMHWGLWSGSFQAPWLARPGPPP